MTNIIWVHDDSVRAIHSRQIAEHGGSDGIRDDGLLLSALARPQNLHAYGKNVDIAALGAAYAFGIAKNHPFVDGNKRTSLVVMRVFLALNDVEFQASQEEKFMTFLKLAEGEIDEEQLAMWIRKHSK
jgi:death on curing protein